ncbi:metallophosphoesterase [soil metagenome]
MRYFTSDLHLGHHNILGYTDRPFATTDDMAEHLIDRWSQVVADDDEVWLLGDLAMGRIDESLPLVGRLPGRIILVPGNHDRCWSGIRYTRNGARNAERVQFWREKYLESGIDEIVDGPCTLELDGTPVRLSHFPFRGGGDHTAEERYTEHRLIDTGGWLLCGHVHHLFRVSGRQINVGIDAWGGDLVPEHTLTELIAQGPAELPPLPWT